MFAFAIVFWYLLIVLNPETTNAQYANDTVQKVRLIGDDFRLFQKTGKRISGRDGRRLISFDTRNDNIEVGLEFSVPFITIPVKKSVDTMKSFASQTTTFISDPIMNINGAAIALSGLVAVGGLATTYLWKSFINDQLYYRNNHFSYGRQFSFNDEFDEDNVFSQFTNKIERLFNNHDINLMICLQKFLCITARDAAKNVAKGRGTSMEKIIDGITSTSLLKRLTAGTAINDAITAGQHFDDCEMKFSECKFKSKNLHQILETVLQNVK